MANRVCLAIGGSSLADLWIDSFVKGQRTTLGLAIAEGARLQFGPRTLAAAQASDGPGSRDTSNTCVTCGRTRGMWSTALSSKNARGNTAGYGPLGSHASCFLFCRQSKWRNI